MTDMDPGLTATGEVRKSSPGHGGARPGSGRPAKTDQGDAYTVLAKAKAKRETYRAQMAELEYRTRMGELLESQVVAETWANHINIAKTALLGLPSKLAHELAATSDPVKIAEIMRERIREILIELAGKDDRAAL